MKIRLAIFINKLLLRRLNDYYLFVKNFINASYLSDEYFYYSAIYTINKFNKILEVL